MKIVKEIKGKRVASPLEIKYWSATPFRLGPATGDPALAVKYSVTSHQANRTNPPDHPEDLADDYFTRALTSALASGEAVFDFKVQRQKDADKQPVEDVSVEWSRTNRCRSPWRRCTFRRRKSRPPGNWQRSVKHCLSTRGTPLPSIGRLAG